MLPLFKTGDQLVVSYFSDSNPAEKLQKGDLVLLKNIESWSVHRLISNNQTKGDRSLFIDIDTNTRWGRIDGVKTHHQIYYWGPSGMVYKKIMALLSERSGTHWRWKRWPLLILLWCLVKMSLSKHKAKYLEI